MFLSGEKKEKEGVTRSVLLGSTSSQVEKVKNASSFDVIDGFFCTRIKKKKHLHVSHVKARVQFVFC